MKFVCTGGPFGDCTSNYNVTEVESLSIDEFVEEVLKHNPREWGDISIRYTWPEFRHSSHRIDDVALLTYKNGAIERKSVIYDSVKNYKVVSCTANGGWSEMSYTIKVDIDNPKEQDEYDYRYILWNNPYPEGYHFSTSNFVKADDSPTVADDHIYFTDL